MRGSKYETRVSLRGTSSYPSKGVKISHSILKISPSCLRSFRCLSFCPTVAYLSVMPSAWLLLDATIHHDDYILDKFTENMKMPLHVSDVTHRMIIGFLNDDQDVLALLAGPNFNAIPIRATCMRFGE